MAAIDSLNYALQISNTKELIELAKNVKALQYPDWHKYIIPVVSLLSAFIGAIGAYIVANSTFKNNSELEIKKIKISDDNQKSIRLENDARELKNRCRVLYGELSGLNYEFLISITILGNSKISSTYLTYLHMESTEDTAKLGEELSNSLLETDKAVKSFNEIYRRYITMISEYMFINRETTIRNHLEKLQATGLKPKYSRTFKDSKDPLDAFTIRNLQTKELDIFVNDEIGLLSHNIINCIYEMK